jgi:hypothetical protein
MRAAWAKAYLVVLTLALIAAGGSLAAQGAPGLAGLWTLDAGRSDANAGPTPMPPGGQNYGPPLQPNQIYVTQSAAEVTISQGARGTSYKLDNTENWAPSIKTNAKMDNGKLVITWRREVYLGPRAGAAAYDKQTGTDTYSVAGDVLTIDKTATTAKGTTTAKAVYTRTAE